MGLAEVFHTEFLRCLGHFCVEFVIVTSKGPQEPRRILSTKNCKNRLQDDIMPCVITPAFKTAATCPIPCCVACKLACACCCPTGATKQLAVEEKAGILSANQYQVGDLVSMGQFVSGTPGRLFSGYGPEA
jgi:hypothetical protein